MIFRLLLCLLFAALFATALPAAELHLGAATVNITPDEPVALSGQRRVRISKKPETPIFASALALESRNGDSVIDQAIIVSCDLVAIRQGILEKVREKVALRLPDFAVEKIFLSATHTHTAPVMLEGRYVLPSEGIMQPAAFADWMTSQVSDVAVEASDHPAHRY